MKIGQIDLGERPVMLAPMEDVTDHSFRLICKEQGADMVYTEFVSADALIRNISATTRKLHINPAERPTAIQIYGRETEPMVEAAKIVEEAAPDILDINFGCPVKKVAGKGAWAGMILGFLTVAVTTIVLTSMNNASCDTVYEAFKLAAKKAPEMGVAAMAVSLATVPVVSMFTKKYDDKFLDGVFAKTADED